MIDDDRIDTVRRVIGPESAAALERLRARGGGGKPLLDPEYQEVSEALWEKHVRGPKREREARVAAALRGRAA